MFSIAQIVVCLLLLVGAACWWIFDALDRQSLASQIAQTIHAIDESTLYWLGKLDCTEIAPYARTKIVCNIDGRGRLKDMQACLESGRRLSFRQLVRLEKLVAEHSVEKSPKAPAPTTV